MNQSLLSLRNVQKLLSSALRSPLQYVDDENFVKALSSQVALAAYSSAKHEIISCSLNSFKLYANRLAGGFREIDRLRKAVKLGLEKCLHKHDQPKSRRSPDSRRGKKQTEQQLKLTLQNQDIALAELLVVIEKLKVLSRNLAMIELPDREAYYIKEIRNIHLILNSIGRT